MCACASGPAKGVGCACGGQLITHPSPVAESVVRKQDEAIHMETQFNTFKQLGGAAVVDGVKRKRTNKQLEGRFHFTALRQLYLTKAA